MKLSERIGLLFNTASVNLKIIFSGKFVYFLISALLFFMVVVTIMVLQDNASVIDDIYDLLLLPGILVMFYPVLYNIQNDKDARMLEIIFGVPNYRYKVYILRFFLSVLLLFCLLLVMAAISWFSVVRIPVLFMVIQLMSPLFFLACLSFLFTTIVRNGNGAAVAVIVVCLLFFMMNEPLANSKWNLFLNPYNTPIDMSLSVWQNVVKQNRLILGIGSMIALLWGLINLQHRERFV
ncbi:MAG: hypothetical protein JXQ80_03095 [Bacteroidales bacterium]|nr:hypothetical protein [Bacteroidales bacterium]